jgi:hypothetical protein
MEDISQIEKTKDVIKGFKVSRESIYYTSLFGVAFIVSIVLAFIGKAQHNKGLVVYASVLIPLFLIAASVSARFISLSKNTIYVQDGVLVIKTFFATRHFEIDQIKKLTSATSGTDGITSINVTYHEKTVRYKFKNLTKDEAMQIKRAVSKR